MHKNISKIIQDILHNTSGDYGWICSTGTHVRNYWPKDASVTVGSIKDIERFILTYNEAFVATKKDFLDKYIDINNFIHDCTLFYTK